MKAYLGYVRFSEDIDFSWKDQSFRTGKTSSRARSHCSSMVSELVPRLRTISAEAGLGFRGTKGDPEQVSIHAGGRMVTFLLPYTSIILGSTQSVRVQIGFYERYLFPFKEAKLRSYVGTVGSEELRTVHRRMSDAHLQEVVFPSYDAREILVEKCRAALTRDDFKLRDLIDIHFIERRLGLKMDKFEDQIIEKTEFSLANFKWVGGNIMVRHRIDAVELGEGERGLLLEPVTPGLQKALARVNSRLETIREKVIRKNRLG
jgi:hypothetical protein